MRASRWEHTYEYSEVFNSFWVACWMEALARGNVLLDTCPRIARMTAAQAADLGSQFATLVPGTVQGGSVDFLKFGADGGWSMTGVLEAIGRFPICVPAP
jgi:hypothetical protein